MFSFRIIWMETVMAVLKFVIADLIHAIELYYQLQEAIEKLGAEAGWVAYNLHVYNEMFLSEQKQQNEGVIYL